jgi:hypothetical protein
VKSLEHPEYLKENAKKSLAGQTYLLEVSYDEMVILENLVNNPHPAHQVDPPMKSWLWFLKKDLKSIHQRVVELHHQNAGKV